MMQVFLTLMHEAVSAFEGASLGGSFPLFRNSALPHSPVFFCSYFVAPPMDGKASLTPRLSRGFRLHNKKPAANAVGFFR